MVAALATMMFLLSFPFPYFIVFRTQTHQNICVHCTVWRRMKKSIQLTDSHHLWWHKTTGKSAVQCFYRAEWKKETFKLNGTSQAKRQRRRKKNTGRTTGNSIKSSNVLHVSIDKIMIWERANILPCSSQSLLAAPHCFDRNNGNDDNATHSITVPLPSPSPSALPFRLAGFSVFCFYFCQPNE